MPNRLTPLARKLRREATSAERELWKAIIARKIEGFRFRRQVAMCGFIVDFACYDARLIVVVDGATHSTQLEVGRDALRDQALRANGNSVLRFTNDEVYQNLEGVLETIRLKLRQLRPRDEDVPCPLVGEGEASAISWRVSSSTRCEAVKIDQDQEAATGWAA